MFLARGIARNHLSHYMPFISALWAIVGYKGIDII